MSDPKNGVYICKGCDIGDSLDIDKLITESEADKQGSCQTHDILCSKEGVEIIQKDIDENGINKVIVCGCSNRSFPELFDFGREIHTERVNLREYVVWTHPANDEDTQMLAEDYVRMGISKATNAKIPEAYTEDTSKDIMIIGGGVSGMTAAKSSADAGYKVHLVEKEDKLGGWATKFKKVFPKHPPYNELEDSNVDALIGEIDSHENITVYKSTTVAKTSGQPGLFEVTLDNNGTEISLKIGGIIQASGWVPYDASKLTHLGYGTTPDIITNIQMEEMAASGDIKRPSDGKPVDSVAFIQCAGSRDEDHLPYCSAVCCRVSLKQALYVRENYPDAKVYVIYKDLRSPAQFEKFYANVQNDDGVFLTKGEIAKVEKDADGKISIDVEETLLGEDIQVKADMVVLAAGMVPTSKPPEVAVEETPAEDDETADTGDDDEKKEAEASEVGAKIINLTYRQGTDLPTLKYGFPDSHFVCFPFETRRTGIYAIGSVRAPMDMASSISDGFGGAMKTIQAVESVSRGTAVHPRSGDPTYPDFFFQRCTQCKRCTEECPFGTLDEDEKGTPLPNPFRCRRCGICMGACPERIISFADYNVNQMSQMIKSIYVPDEFEEKPRILAFVCENDALPAFDMAGLKKMQYNAMIRIIPLRCLGSMNTIWIGDALSSGFDGVILFGCKKGDDYQCHFVRGSELANTRMENVREKLKQLVLEEERVEIHDIEISDYVRIPKIMDDFLEVIDTVGPNPYKDM